MKKNSLSATVLKRILIGSLVLAVIVSILGCYQLQQFLAESTAASSDLRNKLQGNQQELQKVTSLSTYLDQHNDDIDRATAVVADSRFYHYQDQIINDIQSFAGKAQVNVTGYDFAPGSTAPATNKISGLKTITAKVSLADVKYTSFIQFLKQIEQNLTKMQVADITVTPSDIDPNYLKAPIITLQVYTQ